MFGRGKTSPKKELRCSFCNKPESKVQQLIAGPNVYICNECVKICVDILNFEQAGSPPNDGWLRPRGKEWPVNVPNAVLCMLCRMPTPVERTLMVRNRGV